MDDDAVFAKVFELFWRGLLIKIVTTKDLLQDDKQKGWLNENISHWQNLIYLPWLETLFSHTDVVINTETVFSEGSSS